MLYNFPVNYMIIQCMVCFYVVFLSYQMQDLLIEISVFHKVYLGSKRPKEAVEFMRWHPIIDQSMQERKEEAESSGFFSGFVVEETFCFLANSRSPRSLLFHWRKLLLG